MRARAVEGRRSREDGRIEERKSGWEERKKEDARHSYTQQYKNGRGRWRVQTHLLPKGFTL